MATTANPPKTHKRDALVEIEKKLQKTWETEKPHERDAPVASEHANNPKFLATFPYPYMNGALHLGHSFSLSKVEFAIGFERLMGKNALFPFGFHCTGMPIKACADKLKREVELFGQNFENYKEEDTENKEPATAAAADKSGIKKKSKINAKSTGLKYQFQIMASMGVPMEEIHKFADPKHWLYYFPPKAIQDLKDMGVHVDWRRSFITTDVNPYYDSFIRWQFNKLKSLSPPKIQFGERYTIFSPLDGQPCMDHDRSVGEGVASQEYTGIKIKVLKEKADSSSVFCSDLFKSTVGDRTVYYVAATLRPETMYGQTNVFVGKDITYGVFSASDTEAWICTERAAKNMAWQGLFSHSKGTLNKLTEIKGEELVGTPLSAPLCPYDVVYTLPMEGVLPNKGTGVVTSVPSDSPDDCITLMDLSKKAAYYKVDPSWVDPFLPPKSIISTPNYGDLAAVEAIKRFKINSQKDKEQLAQAKEAVYKEGFYNGTIAVGDFKGKTVQEAKPLIRAQLIEKNLAFAYCEPDGLVVSRSGDECVVTLADQWYMDYGEESWKQKALECLANMDTFSPEVRNAFEKNLDWLGQWACSRQFGLGSRLPWDPQWLIESLSDSTIYMAYYSVAHMLQGGALDGSVVGPLGIKADELSDEVWEYIMNEKAPLPASTTISKEKLEKLRNEFLYFYPLDLRCSGKDLVTNHLTFFIYNHVAVFEKEHWPKAVRSNGHLLLNHEKMSKSTGNFMTLRQALDKYGADPMRFALADAGDGLDDANFVDKTADTAILRLFTEKEWCEEVSADVKANKYRTGELNWMDRVFMQEMRTIVESCKQAYAATHYREAMKCGFYDLQNARNEYRKAVTGDGLPDFDKTGHTMDGMHATVLKKFMSVQALVMAPVTPHWSEYIWRDVLENKTSIHNELWPVFEGASEPEMLSAALYMRNMLSSIRSAEDKAASKAAKKGAKKDSTSESRKMKLYVTAKFPEWQDGVVEILKECLDKTTGKFDGSETKELGSKGYLKNKKVMPFVSMVKQNVAKDGEKALDRSLSFNELEVLKINNSYVCRELLFYKVKQVEVVDLDSIGLDNLPESERRKADMATPGNATYDMFDF